MLERAWRWHTGESGGSWRLGRAERDEEGYADKAVAGEAPPRTRQACKRKQWPFLPKVYFLSVIVHYMVRIFYEHSLFIQVFKKGTDDTVQVCL